MPVIDPGSIGGILADLGVSILTYTGIAAILYAIGGILIRTVSWTIDNMLIGLIGKFYDYFEQLLSGQLFTEQIVTDMMNRVYLIIGVIIVFRLGMLIVQYILNPAEVLEEKGGVNSLIKRAIFGLALIIFIPSIFDIANDLQNAILADKVIEKIIMSDEDFAKVEEQSKKYGTGRVIGMTVFQGFWNIEKSQVTDKNIVKSYEDAEEKFDPNLVEDAGYDILTKSGENYAFSYFPILSTVVLAYVLYIVIKYCLDMVVRLLKLFVLQILAPITIVEYIVNGDRNEVFKSWRTSVIANYAMLFMRVFVIWFTAWVCFLLRDGVNGTSLLNTSDYLMKAIIVLGLLAFMMDFPKMLSDIFGLDLEQDSGVKAVMGKAMSAGKMVAGAGLMAGGAALGGIAGRAKANFAGRKQANDLKEKLNNGQITQAEYNKGMAQVSKNVAAGRRASSMGALKGVGLAALSAVPGGNAVRQGFGATTQSMDKDEAKLKEKNNKEELAEEKRQEQLKDTVKSQAMINKGATKQQITDSVLNTQINEKLNGADLGTITADIQGKLTAIQNTGAPMQQQDVIQNVQQVLSNKLDVSQEQTTQIVNQVLGDSTTASPQQVDQIVNQVVQTSKDNMTQEVTQVVNQVMGNVVSGDATSIEQTINQVAGDKVSGNIRDVEQKINQVEGTKIAEKVEDQDMSININVDEPESLLGEDSKIGRRNKDGEIETIFDTNHMDG